MVFAVWAVRRDFAAARPEAVREVHDAFRASLDLSLDRVDEVAAQAARWEPFGAEVLANYFRTLDFGLGEKQLTGLLEFAVRAARARSNRCCS
jgi:chorismate dehydratase